MPFNYVILGENLVSWCIGGRKFLNHQTTKTQRYTNYNLTYFYSIFIAELH
jgi:hypothetical protein